MKIPRVDMATGAPLSFAQQRLWFLDQLVPGRAIYNFPLNFDVEGPLDVSALQRSLQEIVRRHEALRTRFPSSDGTPRQEIMPVGTWDLVLRDVSDRPESERRAAAEQILVEEARRPFDLAEGPVLRTSLIRLGPTSHVLIGNVHHIVIDAWSVGVFLHELMTLYGAYSADLPSPLADLPIRYIDFAMWQRDALTGDALAPQLAYWRDQLRAPRPRLMLPGDRPRPAVQSYRGHRQHLMLRDGFFEDVQQFSRREGVTPFITLLAVYGAMLHRLTGQDDIIIGTPIANRLRQEVEPLIGFFVNTLALRLDLSGQPTFRTLLQRAKRVAFAAYSHQELPFEMLVEELKPERSLAQSPILQALLVLDNTPQTQASQLMAGGVTFKRRMVETGTAKFDLTLLFLRTAAGRRATLEANADLFEPETGARMLREFIQLLETVTADADSVIGRLPVAAAAESQTVPASWNNTVRPFDFDQTIAALFEAQAARTPDADAVLSAGEPMTYRALDEESNRLARALREQGIGPDDRVGISIERSPSLLVGMLAILKAGAAYVPLDATYPSDRLGYIAQDAEIKLLLTSTSLTARLPAGPWKKLCVDARSQDLHAVSAARLPPTAGPANLAYVIYTSGSTGRPKGVAVEHRNVVNLILVGARDLHQRRALGDAGVHVNQFRPIRLRTVRAAHLGRRGGARRQSFGGRTRRRRFTRDIRQHRAIRDDRAHAAGGVAGRRQGRRSCRRAAVADARRAAIQRRLRREGLRPLRPDRDNGLLDGCVAHAWRGRLDWEADCEHDCARPRPEQPGRSSRRARRAVPRRRRCRAPPRSARSAPGGTLPGTSAAGSGRSARPWPARRPRTRCRSGSGPR